MFVPWPRILDDHGTLVRNASVAATELIREAIIDGRLEPGRRLKEEELARELGISRTPIREALLMLQAEGLVDAIPNRGAMVRVHNAEDLEDLYQLRALLEGYAARRAGTRITDEQLDELRASCDRFDALDSETELRELVRENMVFHSTILDIAGSARLAGMVRRVIELPLVYQLVHLVLARPEAHLRPLPPADRHRADREGRGAGRADHEGARLRGPRPAGRAPAREPGRVAGAR